MQNGLRSGMVYMHDVLGTGEMTPLGTLRECELTTETNEGTKTRVKVSEGNAFISGSFKLTPHSIKRLRLLHTGF